MRVPRHRSEPKHEWDLSKLLANRRWLWRSAPFPHIVGRSVFTEPVYRDLEVAFQDCLDPAVRNFKRNMRGYDASGMVLRPDYSGPFNIFLSRAWHDMIAEVMGIEATGDVMASLHHHAPGSASGRPHNDLNPGWFVNSSRPDGVNIADPSRCSYEYGKTANGAQPRDTVRGVAIMFYINNRPWSPGDGGETGLYNSATDSVDRPVVAVPPINNSMLCFECTPYSYHSFIHNRQYPRNSLTMWLHRAKSEAVSRWGEEAIVYW
jgi:2-oxoglutarate-Fe(II)-dependent oxygenase superfamily protein